MHKRLSRALSRLPPSKPVAIVRVSGRLSGLHPIQLRRFRAGMADGPFARHRAAEPGLELSQIWRTFTIRRILTKFESGPLWRGRHFSRPTSRCRISPSHARALRDRPTSGCAFNRLATSAGLLWRGNRVSQHRSNYGKSIQRFEYESFRADSRLSPPPANSFDVEKIFQHVRSSLPGQMCCSHCTGTFARRYVWASLCRVWPYSDHSG